MTSKKKTWLLENVPKKKCRYCFSKDNLTYDHKFPISKGGKTVRKNIQVLCKRCNGIKSSLSHGEVLHFARWIYAINADRAKLGKRPIGIKKLSTSHVAPHPM